jgi:trehalose 6-phosphate synthase
MSAEEKQQRMERMRKIIRDHNVYRWAASLIGEVCDVRLDVARNQFRAGASVG